MGEWSDLHDSIIDIRNRAEAANIPTEEFVNASNANDKNALMHVCQLTHEPKLVATLLQDGFLASAITPTLTLELNANATVPLT